MDAALPCVSLVRCATCGHLDTATRAVCSRCLGEVLRPEQVPGTGRLASFTTIRRAPAAFRDQAPYDVVLVDLDAGPRVTGRLAHDSAPPTLGAQVRLLSHEGTGLVFSVATDAS